MQQNKSVWKSDIIWGVQPWQIAALIGGYLFFAFQYWLAIWYTTGFQQNNWRATVIDYFFLKIPLTIPLWWLLFIKLRKAAFYKKLLIHFLAAPLWIYTWFLVFRRIQDLRGELYLTGAAIWWDVYIPFLIYCIQFAIFHVYDYYLRAKKQQLKEQALSKLAYQSEINTLKAQIQPHFLFNTLNSISASVPAELEKTRELIAKLSDTFRFSLRSAEKDLITILEELEFVRTVLDLEKERFKNKLSYNLDVSPDMLQYKIPPMILQPLVENAIRHGIAPSSDNASINVKAKMIDQFIQFSIADTGVGVLEQFDKIGNSKGVGLANARARLKMLYGEAISVTANKPRGLIFTFRIPAILQG